MLRVPPGWVFTLEEHCRLTADLPFLTFAGL